MRRLKTTQVKPVRDKMLANQGGCCAICTKPLAGSDACLDHDHTTGYLRAVLCRNCNRAEGKIKNLANQAKRKFTKEWYLARITAYWEVHTGIPEHGLVHPTHRTDDEKRLRANKKARERRAAAKG